jgi:hypothetical protein
VARAREHGGLARWYLFGSASEDPSAAADVDVLVVCNSDADADAIRRLVDAIEFYRPLHLSILTEDEEREIGLAERQGCIHVYSGAGCPEEEIATWLSGRGGLSRPEAARGR